MAVTLEMMVTQLTKGLAEDVTGNKKFPLIIPSRLSEGLQTFELPIETTTFWI